MKTRGDLPGKRILQKLLFLRHASPRYFLHDLHDLLDPRFYDFFFDDFLNGGLVGTMLACSTVYAARTVMAHRNAMLTPVYASRNAVMTVQAGGSAVLGRTTMVTVYAGRNAVVAVYAAGNAAAVMAS